MGKTLALSAVPIQSTSHNPLPDRPERMGCSATAIHQAAVSVGTQSRPDP